MKAIAIRVHRPDGGTTDLVIIPDTTPSSVALTASGLDVVFPDTFTIYDRCLAAHTPPGETIYESGLTLREALDSAHSLALLLMEQ